MKNFSANDITSPTTFRTMPSATFHDEFQHEWIVQLTEYISKWWFVFTFVFGIPGNVMSLLVTLKKDNRRISTCMYMAALALIDSTVLVNAALHKMLIIQGWAEELKSSKPFLR
jgi:hypothetical protein